MKARRQADPYSISIEVNGVRLYCHEIANICHRGDEAILKMMDGTEWHAEMNTADYRLLKRRLISFRQMMKMHESEIQRLQDNISSPVNPVDLLSALLRGGK